MWTAVSGAVAQQHAVEAVTNNLANADTVGFKKDAPTFKEYLAHNERPNETVDIPKGAIKDRDLHPLDGKDLAAVVVDGTYSNHQSGGLKVTSNALDLALDGPGYLEISTPNGLRYTRQGSLKMAMDGRLVTSDGNPVLAAGGEGGANVDARAPASVGGADPAIAGRFINLQDRGGISITTQGEVYAGQNLVAKLSIVEFDDPRALRKDQNATFVAPVPPRDAPTQTLVRQGMLEMSNVNPAEEMTKLIQANRLYEMNLKSIKTYDSLMGKEANEVGKL